MVKILHCITVIHALQHAPKHHVAAILQGKQRHGWHDRDCASHAFQRAAKDRQERLRQWRQQRLHRRRAQLQRQRAQLLLSRQKNGRTSQGVLTVQMKNWEPLVSLPAGLVRNDVLRTFCRMGRQCR